jgi:hypothetical protein
VTDARSSAATAAIGRGRACDSRAVS